MNLTPTLRNPETSPSKVTSFGLILSSALILPILLAAGSWITQALLRFPPGSVGESLTALGFMIGLLIEIIPVPIAITKLIRNSHLRKPVNVAVTSLAAMQLVVALLLSSTLFAAALD